MVLFLVAVMCAADNRTEAAAATLPAANGSHHYPITPYNHAVDITVNSQSRSVPDNATVSDLLVLLKLQGSACAVEVNRSLIPKRQHDQTKLSPDDIIEVVTLVGGG